MIVLGGLFGGYPAMLGHELACADALIELHRSGHPVAVQSAFALTEAEPLARLKRDGIPVVPSSRPARPRTVPPADADHARG